MRMSVTMTCGASSVAPSTRPSKSSATPTTSRSGCAASRARTPSRTSSESSARNTVIRGVVTEPLDRIRAAHKGGRPLVRVVLAPLTRDGRSPVDRGSESVGCVARPVVAVRKSEARSAGRKSCGSTRASSRVLDPFGGRHGHEQARLREWCRTLRRAAAGRDRATSTSSRPPTGSGSRTCCAAWIEVEDGRIVGAGYADDSGGSMGATTVRSATKEATFAAPGCPTSSGHRRSRARPLRFVQTVGGRTALPAPRRVNRPPFVQFQAPLVWTTLELTMHADGRSEFAMSARARSRGTGSTTTRASSRPRPASPTSRTGSATSFGKHTPWGDEDSPALVTAVETALERELADHDHPRRREADGPQAQGGPRAHRAGPARRRAVPVARRRAGGRGRRRSRRPSSGPGAILGERAVSEGGRRTATLRAITRCGSRSRGPTRSTGAPRARSARGTGAKRTHEAERRLSGDP